MDVDAASVRDRFEAVAADARRRAAACRVAIAPVVEWDVGALDLASRADRLRAYEIVLREGMPSDIVGVVDGVLLCEGWADLVMPVEARDAW